MCGVYCRALQATASQMATLKLRAARGHRELVGQRVVGHWATAEEQPRQQRIHAKI